VCDGGLAGVRRRRLLTLGHSYVASVNRVLARELEVAGGERWDVTCAAPRFFHGGEDLAPVVLQGDSLHSPRLVPLSVFGSSRVHLFCYGPELAQLLRQPWDLVHVWEEPFVVAGWEIAMLCPKGAKLVFRTAQINSRRFPPPWSWFEAAAMGRAAGWICPGKAVEAHLAALPRYASPHLVSPLGVDVDVFNPNPATRERTLRSLGWEDQSLPVVGYVGRFVAAKGLRLLMDALDRVRVPHRVLFVGAGVLEPELTRFGAERGLDFRMLHAEHVRVPDYINAMDLLCAPSQTTTTWREQFGRMLIEAMACGVPVIGSDSGEVPEVIGSAGVVVGERDVPAWSHAIESLLDDPGRRRDLVARGQTRVQECFTWPVIARDCLRFLESL
jgi:phosphatidyl-myo-inositol dimannoside synthase